MSSTPSIRWDSPYAIKVAKDIDSVSGVYCGPASVVWIAAVWHEHKGTSYDYIGRLKNKKLFPDGPRPFHLNLPGFQLCLGDLLKRETNNALALSEDIYFSSAKIKEVLDEGMPLIIRMPAAKFKDGLHYVTAYGSSSKTIGGKKYMQFQFQDNGVFKGLESRRGLSKSHWRSEGALYLWGAKRVVPAAL